MVSNVNPSAVDIDQLRDNVKSKYSDVATNPDEGFHFHTGRPLALMLAYTSEDLDGLPESAIESFAGTGNPFSWGRLKTGETVVDVGSGAGFDSLQAARHVGPDGSVIGVDMTQAMLDKATEGAQEMGLSNTEFRLGYAEALPVADASADVVISNGVINLTPDAEVLAKRDDAGLRWSYDPDGCCEIRKVIPLAKALSEFDASVTGRKGFQAETRAGLPIFELDTTDAAGRLKINPLIDWDAARLSAYMDEHDVPRHPLVAQGYPSIGCMPCTSKVAPGEDPRSGRWRGWDKTECGIHVEGAASSISDLPPGYEPAF